MVEEIHLYFGLPADIKISQLRLYPFHIPASQLEILMNAQLMLLILTFHLYIGLILSAGVWHLRVRKTANYFLALPLL